MNKITLSPLCSLTSITLAKRDSHSLFSFGSSGDKTWAEFLADLNTYTAFLTKQQEERWAICIQDSYWFAVVFFALCHAKKALILPSNHQIEAIRELSSEFDALIHDSPIFSTDTMTLDHNLVLNIDNISTDSMKNDGECSELVLDNVSVTLFTSGSSGYPKAIKKTLSHFNHELSQLEHIWAKQFELGLCRVYSTVSHHHIYGLLFRLLWPICANRPFARDNLHYPEQVINHSGNNAILISSPALLKRLNSETSHSNYKIAFSSGGPLSTQAAKQSLKYLGSLPFEVFGSTETGGIGYRQQNEANTPWTLFPDVKAKVNAEGCIALLSGHIDPDHWYQTSDQCELYENGTFLLKGRADRIIKIEEKRVSLINVEMRLQHLPWIEEAMVIGIHTSARFELVAAITLNKEGHNHVNAIGKGPFWIKIRQSLRQWLEPISIPRRYRIIDDIPLNSQGKRLVRDVESLFN